MNTRALHSYVIFFFINGHELVAITAFTALRRLFRKVPVSRDFLPSSRE